MPRTRKHYRVPVTEKVIGQRLREFRKRQALSQAELADKLGITQSIISEYELGNVRLHAALLAGFARVLNASADEILGLEKAKNNGVVGDRRFVRRLDKIQQLPNNKKQMLLGTIDAVLKSSGLS